MQGSKKYIGILMACFLMALLSACGTGSSAVETSAEETTTVVPTTAANDGRADYWEDSYSFSMMPYFKVGKFNGCISTGYVQSLSFTEVDRAAAETYLETVKKTKYFTRVNLTTESDHFNYHVQDPYGIDYYVYYDIKKLELDLTVDTSAVMSQTETNPSQ